MPTTMFMAISTKDNHQGNCKDQNIEKGLDQFMANPSFCVICKKIKDTC